MARRYGGDNGKRARGRGRGARPAPYGDLKVVTTNMKAGYLRKNGVPYSENAVLTEYYDVIRGRRRKSVAGGHAAWWTIRQYLRMSFITSSNFKKQADGSGWDPSPCSARGSDQRGNHHGRKCFAES